VASIEAARARIDVEDHDTGLVTHERGAIADAIAARQRKLRRNSDSADFRGASMGRNQPPKKGISVMMNRRNFAGSLAALSVSASLAQKAVARTSEPGVQQPMAPAPLAVRNVVLVHGLFADGSSWGKVIPFLQRAGMNVTAVQNPLTSFQDDVAATLRAIALQDGPTVLVAHSYGGMVISEAGMDPKVAALVYVAARAPDAGEDYGALARQFPTPPATAGISWAPDGFGQLTEEAFLRDFAGDLEPAEARAYCAVQGRVAKATPAARTKFAAWRSKPSWYAVSTLDRTIDTDLERFMAKRMDASTIELQASHVSLLSRPQEVSALILDAAAGLRR
jgi:pimeloyl-ACP methyl ester carboxylesterase